MSYGQYLRELLRPLHIYDLEAPFHGGELDAAGRTLYQVQAALEETERETSLTTAETWGLERTAELFVRRPVAGSPRALAAALAALLRIGGDSFTLPAINDTLAGCGVPARAEEIGVEQVRISFPGQAGIPKGFEEMKQIIEEILPSHLGIAYWFWYLTWAELEARFDCWQDIEDLRLSWEELEVCMV